MKAVHYFHCSYPTVNSKLGPIAAITASRNTCPTDCPVQSECYHDQGYMKWHWDKIDHGTGKNVLNFEHMLDWVRLMVPPITPLRYGVAGDIPGSTPGEVRSFLQALSGAAGKRPAWLYTHRHEHRRKPAYLDALLDTGNLRVNVSCELERQADAAVRQGLLAVLIVSSSEKRTAWTTAGGNRAVLCPHSRLKPDPRTPQCISCGLCWERPSHVIICFPAHGIKKKQLNQKLARLR